MSFDLQQLINDRQGENLSLHSAHINPQMAKVLKTIGFDRSYVKANGAYLYDINGERTIDFLAGYGVYNMGRNHPTLKKCMQQFLDLDLPSLVQMDAPLLAGLLAESLKKHVPPSLDRVYLTNSGTESVETAIKFARCATKRARLLYCHSAFHGLSNGSLSMNGSAWFKEGFEPLLPYCNQIPLNDLDVLEAELAKRDVAAFFVEPIQGKGVQVADDLYLKEAKALCKKYGTLLVVDEIQTGLGRTGKMFAFEHSGIEPDIILLSKSLSGGYVPIGAVITSAAIHGSVFSSMDRCVVHSSTFGQGCMAAAAGLATLSVLKEDNLLENAAHRGETLLAGLKSLCDQFEVIKDVRGRGLMVGIEFARPTSLKLRLGWDMANKLNAGLFTQALVISLFRDYGILTQVAGKNVDIIKLIPPLMITDEDVQYFLKSFQSVLERSQRFPGPVWDLVQTLAKHAIKR